MWDFCARSGQDIGLLEEWGPPPVATRALRWAIGGDPSTSWRSGLGGGPRGGMMASRVPGLD
eukprot:8648329-Alexandrium_andersonii.AAC.1